MLKFKLGTPIIAIFALFIFLSSSAFAVDIQKGDNWAFYNDVGYIYITTVIDSDLFQEVASAMDFFQSAQAKLIKVHINSSGGGLFDSIGIAQIFLSMRDKIRIETYGSGIVGSGATLIIMAGTPGYRHAYADTIFMLHSTIMGRESQYVTLAETTKDVERHIYLQNIMESMYLKQLKISAQELKVLLNKEFWGSAQDAVRLGLVDKVLGN